MADIFICYSGNEDKIVALQIANALEKDGWDIFIDNDRIAGGAEWHTRIFEHELPKAQCLLAVISQKEIIGYMKDEVMEFRKIEENRMKHGMNLNEHRIIPVYIKECSRPSLFTRYTDLEFVGWDGNLSSILWKKLIDALSQWVKRINDLAQASVQEINNNIKKEKEDLIAVLYQCKHNLDAYYRKLKLLEDQIETANFNARRETSSILDLERRFRRAQNIYEYRYQNNNDGKLIAESKRYADKLNMDINIAKQKISDSLNPHSELGREYSEIQKCISEKEAKIASLKQRIDTVDLELYDSVDNRAKPSQTVKADKKDVDIFFSYARVDQERVLPIIRNLQEQGHKVYFDEHVRPGEEWLIELESHLSIAKYLLVAVSSASNESRWIRREIMIFESPFNATVRSVIPIKIEHVEMQMLIIDRQWVDLVSWNQDTNNTQWLKLTSMISAT